MKQFVALSIAAVFALAMLSVSAQEPEATEVPDALAEAASEQLMLIERIDAVQAESGPLAAELIEPLSALAVFYEENGDDILSVATRERVMQLYRANFGLYSMEQVPALILLLDDAQLRTDYETAWNLEQQLIEVARRHPDDLRTVDIRKRIGDSRLDLLQRFIDGEFVPQVEYGCFFAAKVNESLQTERVCSAGSLRAAAQGILTEAFENYDAAIATLQRNDPDAHDQLRQLSMETVRALYTYGKYLGDNRSVRNPISKRDPTGCEVAEDWLARLHGIHVEAAAPLEDRAEALILSADYKLLCRQHAEAVNAYESAMQMLISEGASQALIDRFFSPQRPIDLPTFVDGALDYVPEDPDTPYIEVRFELTRFGTTRQVRVVAGESKREASYIVSRIKRGLFRPVAQDGEIERSQPFVVRYYLEPGAGESNRPPLSLGRGVG